MFWVLQWKFPSWFSDVYTYRSEKLCYITHSYEHTLVWLHFCMKIDSRVGRQFFRTSVYFGHTLTVHQFWRVPFGTCVYHVFVLLCKCVSVEMGLTLNRHWYRGIIGVHTVLHTLKVTLWETVLSADTPEMGTCGGKMTPESGVILFTESVFSVVFQIRTSAHMFFTMEFCIARIWQCHLWVILFGLVVSCTC